MPQFHLHPDAEIAIVPGGAGFLGSHLCERLIAEGRRVIALDDFSSGDARHLDDLKHHASFRWLEADIVQPLPPAVDEGTHIYNLACPASPAYYQRRPIQTTLTSSVGVWRLLESASRSGARLLQASTSEIYGDPLEHPQREEYWGNVNPFGPRSCYDEGKRCAEAMLYSYRVERGTDVRIARLFNCYGPRLSPGDGRVVSNFIVQALRGEPLTVYGDGSQTRSFCYVDDTVEGLLRLMRSSVEQPVNLGNPIERTVLDLAEHVLRLTGSRSELQRVPLPVDDPQRRRPDIARAREQLGWEPRVSLEDGLAATIDHFRHVLGVDERHVSLPPG